MPEDPFVEVTGYGSTTTTPDRARIHVAAVGKANAVGEAFAAADASLKAMLSAARDHGAADEDLRSTHIDVRAGRGHPDGRSYESVGERNGQGSAVRQAVRARPRCSLARERGASRQSLRHGGPRRRRRGLLLLDRARIADGWSCDHRSMGSPMRCRVAHAATSIQSRMCLPTQRVRTMDTRPPVEWKVWRSTTSAAASHPGSGQATILRRCLADRRMVMHSVLLSEPKRLDRTYEFEARPLVLVDGSENCGARLVA